MICSSANMRYDFAMDGWSFALGMLAGVVLTVVVSGLCAVGWLLANGRYEWRKLLESVSLRRDLDAESVRMADDISDLEIRKSELQRHTPPRIPSLQEVKNQRGIG